MIEIQNLSRCRAGQQVLRDVTLRIRNGTEAGNFCALIGSAGAGKTTLLEMMAGCIRPDGGTVQISGYDIVRQPREAKKQIGYLPQGMKPPADMTVWEYLDFVAGAKRLRRENAVRQIAAVCRQTAITDVQDKRIGALRISSADASRWHRRCWENRNSSCWMTPQKDWTPPRAPDCTASSGKSARDAQSSRQGARPPDCTPIATASFCSTGAG